MRSAMNSKKIEKYMEIGFCVVVFALLLVWAGIQPFNASPDEYMRLDVINYVFNHGALPHGGDAAIRNDLWGISYAFQPYLSGILSALFMKVTSIFTTNDGALLMAARMVNVFFGVGTTFITMRIGKRLFKDEAKWLFTALVALLPGAFFLFTYVNNDGIAIFSTALMILMWARSMQDGWSLKTCMGLAIGVSVCALAYYNAYGVILCSIIFFVATVLTCREKKFDGNFLVKRGAIITGIVLVLVLWWFIRSYIIYDGDFLGLNTSSIYAQQYAVDELKPSNRQTMQSMGNSIVDMFFYVHPGWINNWLITVMTSFIGTFGYMSVYMPWTLTKLYMVFLGVGVVGVLFGLKKGFFDMRGSIQNRKENIFRWCMALAIIIPVALLIYYSYASDLQAQGRYIMSALIPLMYFVAWGYRQVLQYFVKSKQVREIFYWGSVALILVGLLYTTFAVFVAQYI